MALHTPLETHNVHLQGRGFFQFNKVNHDTSSSTVKVDQTATAVTTVMVSGSGTAPTASLGSGDSDGLKTCTLTGGTQAEVWVITRHPGSIAGSSISV